MRTSRQEGEIVGVDEAAGDQGEVEIQAGVEFVGIGFASEKEIEDAAHPGLGIVSGFFPGSFGDEV